VPVTSPQMLLELERAVRRRELRVVFSKPKRIVALVAEMCMVVEPVGRLEVVEKPSENRLLEVAQTAGATYLVTSEISLLQLGEFRGTRIVRPL
jgi:predicted nucleic acid-binding protein